MNSVKIIFLFLVCWISSQKLFFDSNLDPEQLMNTGLNGITRVLVET